MTTTFTPEILTRRVETILPSRDGLAEVMKRRPIRLYLGIDPTGFQLHLGHAVVLKKIQEFVDSGHEVIFLVGSFTGRIGDPSDRESERTQLDDGQIQENMKDYQRQAGKIIDFSKTRFVYNGDWLSKLNFEDVVKLAANFTVQQMIEREMFQKRLQKSKPIYLHEFFYPLMQGYDSVHLEVDLEIGGTDQLFNMLAGRTLLRIYKNKDKFVLTTPLLMGTDGQKMSKSIGNCIWLDDSVQDMFGKIMSIQDEQIVPYMELVTDIPLNHIAEIKDGLSLGKVHPMEAKKELAIAVVSQFYGGSVAQEAGMNFERTIQRGEAPESIPTFKLSDLPAQATIIDLLTHARVVASRGEAKRLVTQGGISIDGDLIQSPEYQASSRLGTLKVGKRKWLRLE